VVRCPADAFCRTFSLTQSMTMSSLSERRPPTMVVLQHIENTEQAMKRPTIKKSYKNSSPRSILDQKSVDQQQASTDAFGGTIRKQRRLTLLHHASICTHENCNEFVYCQAMKRLYHHILSCDGRMCVVPGCKKNRQAWKHYQTCKDKDSCVICSSVKK
jgi:hypothetical protein